MELCFRGVFSTKASLFRWPETVACLKLEHAKNLIRTPKMSLCFSLSETVELLNRREMFLKLKLGSMKAGGTTTRSGSGSSGGGANGGASGAPVDE